MSLARLQHEVEELRRRIEELKMKLTAEMKVQSQSLYNEPLANYTKKKSQVSCSELEERQGPQPDRELIGKKKHEQRPCLTVVVAQ